MAPTPADEFAPELDRQMLCQAHDQSNSSSGGQIPGRGIFVRRVGAPVASL
jgi:hypothetical protein